MTSASRVDAGTMKCVGGADMGSWAGSQRSGRCCDGVRRTYHGGRWGNIAFWSEELFFSTVSGYSSLSSSVCRWHVGEARSKDFVVEIWSVIETDLGDMLLGAKEIVLVIFMLSLSLSVSLH
ncbi:hypothetical protein ACQJBY_024414 [Aegilops geniculata]